MYYYKNEIGHLVDGTDPRDCVDWKIAEKNILKGSSGIGSGSFTMSTRGIKVSPEYCKNAEIETQIKGSAV